MAAYLKPAPRRSFGVRFRRWLLTENTLAALAILAMAGLGLGLLLGVLR